MGTVTRALFALPFLLLGCRGEHLAAPGRVDSIDPSAIVTTFEGRLLIRGEGFQPRVVADLDHASKSSGDFQFSARAERDDGTTVELPEVSFVDSEQLTAKWPIGAGPGSYVVKVVDPWGRTLEGA